MKLSVSWLIGALFLISCGGRAPHLHVPGNPDEVEHVYESVVALVREVNGDVSGPYCTATYVSPRLLATAAHCVPAVRHVTIAPGITIEIPGASQTPIGQKVSFLEHHHYNEWIQRGLFEDGDQPVVTHAIVVAVDDENDHDVALLELATEEDDADHWLNMRNLEDEPILVGSHAYSVSMPVGQIWILTEGMISRVHVRTNNTVDILHQVRIGPGSSGSALLDDDGNIIGINSAGWGGRGTGIILGQAKPISYIQTLIKVLKTQKEINQLDRDFEQSRSGNA